MTRLARLVALILILSACGGSFAAPESTTSSLATTTSTVPPTTTTSTVAEAANYYAGFNTASLPEDMTLVAMSRGELAVYNEPETDLMTTLPETTVIGTVTVVAVTDDSRDGWLEVMLPIRPNGSKGWVRRADVDLFVVAGRVVVDLSDKTLTYYRGDQVILTSEVAIGTERNPTPVGAFFVTDNVTLSNPGSPWGPHALGLSGRSDTITEYNGGDGIIGIHGTNRPDSIGRASSLGCVRLPNDVITALHEAIAVGTPVEIRA